MRSRLCLYALCAAFVVVPQLEAQQELTGTVRDQRSGQPLSAVQVFVAGSGMGALSQQNGRYLIPNAPVGVHQVTAQRIGYTPVTQSATVTAGQTVVLDFALAEEALGLSEIIVTGTPGGTQRRAIGNSVVSVDAADITEDIVIPNLSAMLQGRNPG